MRWSEISVVLQSALNALNPVITIGAQFDDLLKVHRPQLTESERWDRGVQLMEMVGMTGDRLRSYSHELSGGMRQRAMIAMALALEPQVMILDEPTTALDVVTQREILEELMGLRDRLGFAALFITHDLSLLVELADEIVVMYAGRLMERAAGGLALPVAAASRTRTVSSTASRPCTGSGARWRGSPDRPPTCGPCPSGCAFHPRCPWAMERCRKETPALVRLDGSGREAACWLHSGEATVPAELDLPDPAHRGPRPAGERDPARRATR